MHAYRGGERGDEVGRDTVVLLVNRKMGLIEGMYYFVRDVNIFNVFTAIFEGQNLFSREHVQVMHEYWYLFCISAGLGFGDVERVGGGAKRWGNVIQGDVAD